MNSIVSLLLILETEKQEALIENLCEKLVKFREGERPSLRMQLWVLFTQLLWTCNLYFSSLVHLLLLNSLFSLSNLFHGMDENTPVRHTVYCSLIKVAATCNAIAFIPTELDQVQTSAWCRTNQCFQLNLHKMIGWISQWTVNKCPAHISSWLQLNYFILNMYV